MTRVWRCVAATSVAAAVVVLANASSAGAATPAYIRAEGTNPTIAQKVLGYDAWVRRAGRQPDTVVLGSSRSVMLDPHYIRRVSGRTSYNAGISNGVAHDLLTMGSFADLRTPWQIPHLVILLDLESVAYRSTSLRRADYQRRIVVTRTACGVPAECQFPWLRSARAIAADALRRQRGGRPYSETQRLDGKQINGQLQKWEAQGISLATIRQRRMRERVASYRPGGFFTRLSPVQRQSFARLMALANQRGDRPTVVLTPMHPDCIRICGPAGWNARRSEVRAWLAELGETQQFQLLDFSLPAMWRGSGADFLDEIHLREAGANKVAAAIERFSGFDRAPVEAANRQ